VSVWYHSVQLLSIHSMLLLSPKFDVTIYSFVRDDICTIHHFHSVRLICIEFLTCAQALAAGNSFTRSISIIRNSLGGSPCNMLFNHTQILQRMQHFCCMTSSSQICFIAIIILSHEKSSRWRDNFLFTTRRKKENICDFLRYFSSNSQFCMATNDKRNTVIVDPSSMLEDEQLDIIHIS
jgi:hypothetical protein